MKKDTYLLRKIYLKIVTSILTKTCNSIDIHRASGVEGLQPNSGSAILNKKR